MNKSIISNLIALAILLFGFVETPLAGYCFAIGIFALSGGITNWLPIHMLFEKIPFIIGSGVVEIRFEEFKKGIRHLILEEFFNKENIESIYKSTYLKNIQMDINLFDLQKSTNACFFNCLRVMSARHKKKVSGRSPRKSLSLIHI